MTTPTNPPAGDMTAPSEGRRTRLGEVIYGAMFEVQIDLRYGGAEKAEYIADAVRRALEEAERGSCCPGRCYCGHDTCHAFASWTPRPVLNVTDISKPKGKKGSAWADREESTWIDKM